MSFSLGNYDLPDIQFVQWRTVKQELWCSRVKGAGGSDSWQEEVIVLRRWWGYRQRDKGDRTFPQKRDSTRFKICSLWKQKNSNDQETHCWYFTGPRNTSLQRLLNISFLLNSFWFVSTLLNVCICESTQSVFILMVTYTLPCVAKLWYDIFRSGIAFKHLDKLIFIISLFLASDTICRSHWKNILHVDIQHLVKNRQARQKVRIKAMQLLHPIHSVGIVDWQIM